MVWGDEGDGELESGDGRFLGEIFAVGRDVDFVIVPYWSGVG